jgi:hypothetical protein
MKAILAAQPDFKAQKGRLQEELEAANQTVMFYPKFHCELNFIERFWCAAKWYTCENCLFSIQGLRETVPAALKSISSASINQYYHRSMRILEAYESGETYGTQAFKDRVYKHHCQVVDKTKWQGTWVVM